LNGIAGYDRTEILFVEDLIPGAGAIEHGRRHEVSALLDRLAASHRANALSLTGFQEPGHPLELLRRDQRTHLGLGVQPVADLDTVGAI
jgi:hypothetical protein